MSRYDFVTRKQRENESMTDYLKELKRLAIPCKFGQAFDERLRDQVMIGVLDENLIKRLLSEPKLDTFQKAMDIALNTEWATHTARRLKNQQSAKEDLEVNNVNRKPKAWQKPSAATASTKQAIFDRRARIDSDSVQTAEEKGIWKKFVE